MNTEISAVNMRMRGLSTVLLVCLSFLGTGCFVFEEIDKGMAIMEHNSPQKKPAAESGDTKNEAGGKLSLAALRKTSVELFNDLSIRVEEALKKAPDPEDVVVNCVIEGRTEFTRKFDCQSRGGRVALR